jgi:hypothetical protein
MASVTGSSNDSTPSLHVTQEQGASYVVEVSNTDNDYNLEIRQSVAAATVVVTPVLSGTYNLVVSQNITDNQVVIGGGTDLPINISDVTGLQAALDAAGSSGGEENVQSDWNVTNAALDSFILNKPTLFSGAYADLTGKPTLFDGAYSSLSGLPTLFSGSYNDLTNLPTLFDGDYNSLTNLPSLFDGTWASLTGKPTLFDGDYNSLTNLPTLFSGSYNDLSDKPTLFDGDYGSLTNVPTTFAPSAHTHTASEITDFDTEVSNNTSVAANTAKTSFPGFGTTAGTALEGDTALFSGAYGDLTGTPTLGTAAATDAADYATSAQGALADSALQAADIVGLATETYVDNAITNVIDAAPAALDTLNELAASLNDDADFAGTMTTALAGKSDTGHTHTASDITDFDTEVSNNTSVAANTAKTSFPGFGTTAGTALEGDTALFSGAYADLTGKPTIPTNNNELTNGAGYITGYTVTEADVTAHEAALAIDYSQLTSVPSTFAPSAHTHTASEITDFDTEVSNNTNVAANTSKVTFPGFGTIAGTALEGNTALFSGAYADLTGKPTLFDGDYNSLTNLPTLFDGDYNSLTNLPSLFDGAYGSLTGTPDLTTYVPYSGATGTVNLNSQDLSGVDTVTATSAMFGPSPSNLRAFNVHGTGLNGRLSIQGGSGDAPGVEMTIDGNTSRALIRMVRIGTDGTALEIFTEPDGGAIARSVTFDDDGTLYVHDTSAKDAGIRNSSGTMQFLNSGGSWTNMGSGSGGGEANVQVDWDETDAADDSFILNKPSIPSSVDDLSDVDTTTSTASTGDVLRWNGSNWAPDTPASGGTQADWDETDAADPAFILNKPTAVAELTNHLVTTTLASEYLLNGASVMDFDYTSQTQVLNLSATTTVGTNITWASDKFTVNADGMYTVTAAGQFNTVGIQRAMPALYIAVNGVVQEGADSAYLRGSGSAFDDSASLTRTFDLTSGDEVTLVMENIGNHSGTAVRAKSLLFEMFSHEVTVTGVEGAGENNVQSDWNQTDSSADSFILNKPTVPSSINDLSDVDTTTSAASTGDVLEWDGSDWVPAAPSGGGGGDPVFIWERHAYNTVATSEQSKYFWPGSSISGFIDDVATETSTVPSSFTNNYNQFKKITHRPQSGTYDLSVRFEVSMSSNTTGTSGAPDFQGTDIDCSIWKVAPDADGYGVTITQIGSTSSVTLDATNANYNKVATVTASGVVFNGSQRLFCVIKGNATAQTAQAYAHWVYDVVATKTA